MKRACRHLRTSRSPAGYSLIEASIASVIVGLTLVAAVHAVGAARSGEVRRTSANQASTLIQDLHAEISGLPYEDSSDTSGASGPSNVELVPGNRSLFNDVNDYRGWVESPPRAKDGSPLGLDSSWRRSVAVEWVNPSNPSVVVGTDAGLVRVTVSVLRNGAPVGSIATLHSRGLPATEACSLPSAQCVNLVPLHCLAAGGSSRGPGTSCWTTAEAPDTPAAAPVRMYFSRTAIKDVRSSQFDSSSSTWGASTLSGSTVEHGPQGVRAAILRKGTLVVTARWDERIYAALCDDNEAGTYTNICSDSDCGLGDRRPFDVAAEGSSGDGLIAYWDVAAASMRTRTVEGDVISSPIATGLSTSAARYVRLVPLGASDDRVMLLVVDTSNRLFAALWSGSAWGSPVTLSTTLNGSAFDVAAAVLDTTGELLVAYSTGTSRRFAHRLYSTGSGWSSSATHSGFDGSMRWMKMAAEPGTQNAHLLLTTEDNTLYETRWNGSNWSTPTTLASNVDTSHRPFDLAYCGAGEKFLVIYNTGSSDVWYRTVKGSSWTAAARAFTLSTGSARTILAHSTGPDGLIVGAVGDSNANTLGWTWNGTSFGTVTSLGKTDAYMSDKERFAIVGGTP